MNEEIEHYIGVDLTTLDTKDLEVLRVKYNTSAYDVGTPEYALAQMAVNALTMQQLRQVPGYEDLVTPVIFRWQQG